jgi:hypothetical protein
VGSDNYKLLKTETIYDGKGENRVTFNVSYNTDWSPWVTNKREKVTITGLKANQTDIHRSAIIMAQTKLQCRWCDGIDAANQGMEARFSIFALGQSIFKIGKSFTLKDYNSFKGAKPANVSYWLNQNGWKAKSTNSNKVYADNLRYTNGVTGEQIRIMKGGATRSILEKTGPYMEISIKGKKTVIVLYGNPTLK